MKKYLFVSLAMVFAIVSAFAFQSTKYYFEFQGDSADWQDRVDEAMYVKANPTCGTTEVVLCKIYAPDSDGDNLPDIGTSGALYNALSNGQTAAPNFAPLDVVGRP